MSTHKQAPLKKRRGRKMALLAAAATGVLMLAAAGAFLFRGLIWRPAYDAAQPTAAKFSRIARWIPPSADLTVALDARRAMENPSLSEGLAAIARSGGGVGAEFISALLERQSAIGMLLLVGRVGEAPAPLRLALVAQGGFDEKTFVPAIRAILAAGRAGLVAEKIGGRTLYAESDERDPFAFVVLDREHIATGNRASLVELFTDGPWHPARVDAPPDAALFGHLAVGPRLRALLPAGLPPVADVEFTSHNGKTIVATLKGQAPGDIAMFLEGVRSLLLLQREGDRALTAVLQGIAVERREGEVLVKGDLLPLIGLWSKRAGAKLR